MESTTKWPYIMQGLRSKQRLGYKYKLDYCCKAALFLIRLLLP